MVNLLKNDLLCSCLVCYDVRSGLDKVQSSLAFKSSGHCLTFYTAYILKNTWFSAQLTQLIDL